MLNINLQQVHSKLPIVKLHRNNDLNAKKFDRPFPPVEEFGIHSKTMNTTMQDTAI